MKFYMLIFPLLLTRPNWSILEFVLSFPTTAFLLFDKPMREGVARSEALEGVWFLPEGMSCVGFCCWGCGC